MKTKVVKRVAKGTIVAESCLPRSGIDVDVLGASLVGLKPRRKQLFFSYM
ncbi:MAG TPA: hypothetical protein VI031_05685 [Pyrinomonadaceae bacterium]